MKRPIFLLLTLCFLSFSSTAYCGSYSLPENVSLTEIVKTAEKGDIHSQYLIGYSVLLDEEILGEKYKNRAQAMQWLDNAIAKKPYWAETIGTRLQRKGRLVDAQVFFQKAINLGHKAALYKLAMLYLGSNHSKRGNLLAKRYFEAAASYGDSEGYIRIGHIYQNGWGGEQNFMRAKEYFHKAINSGNTRGYSALAFMKEKDLTNPDYKEILSLYLKDALYGHPTAITGIKRLYADHKKEANLSQEDVLFWQYIQRYHMVESLNFPKTLLEQYTNYHNGLTEKQISNIKREAEALVKSFSNDK
jgi:TPR repeat protein